MEPSTERRDFHVALAAMAIALFTFSFTFLYWNRFLAPSSGATSFYAAERILAGEVPYRDFLFLTPPLHALKIAALIRLFGERLAVPRIEAMFERTILSVMLFVWLARCCRISASFLATMVAMVVFACDMADSLANYHHDSVFWAVGAGLFASLSLDNPRSVPLSVASGLFAGLCFATKQTTGAAVLVSIPTLVTWWTLRARKGGIPHRFLVLFLLGWSLPIAALLIWLARAHALGAFWASVFLNGGSKGSLWTLLTRPFLQMPGMILLSLGVVAAVSLLLRRFGRRQTSRAESPIRTILAVCCSAAVLGCGAWTARSAAAPALFSRFIWFHWFLILLALVSCGLVFLVLSYRPIEADSSKLRGRRWFLSGLSFAIAYALALSWPAYSPMVVPALALVVAIALDRLEASAPGAMCALGVVVVSLVAYIHASYKLTVPFSWMFWQEQPVIQATHRSRLPQLQGLLISEPTLDITERITSIIQANSGPRDSVLVYPYFPIFYVLSRRNPPTYSFNHFVDVCPDPVCASDAALTLRARPAIIVYMVESVPLLTALEAAYRGGRPSRSRDVVDAIERLAKDYRLLYTCAVPGSSRRVDVYGRK